MGEVGIDISRQRSKHVEELGEVSPNLVVTVCDSAREACPVWPGGTMTRHVSFDDPPHLAATAASEEEAMAHYRRVRDEIRAMVEALPPG